MKSHFAFESFDVWEDELEAGRAVRARCASRVIGTTYFPDQYSAKKKKAASDLPTWPPPQPDSQTTNMDLDPAAARVSCIYNVD